jgi:hypothetical protein
LKISLVNSVQCHLEIEGEKAKINNLPNHTKDEMENRSLDRIRSKKKKEGRQLRSHRVVKQLETIQRGEKGGVGILVGKELPRNDRKSLRGRPEAGKFRQLL